MTVITIKSGGAGGSEGPPMVGVSGPNGVKGHMIIEEYHDRLGPNQLDWLRKNLIHNGVAIFELYERQRSTRAHENDPFRTPATNYEGPVRTAPRID